MFLFGLRLWDPITYAALSEITNETGKILTSLWKMGQVKTRNDGWITCLVV